MKFLKGITVAIWIWIIGGLVLAFFGFLIVYNMIMSHSSENVRRDMLNQYNELYGGIELTCFSAVGHRESVYLRLKGVKAIYASNINENVDPKAPYYIANGNISSGKYICISFDDEDFRCKRVPCLVNMTYMGTPMKESRMYKIGIVDGFFDFKVTVEKPKHNFVNVTAIHVP